MNLIRLSEEFVKNFIKDNLSKLKTDKKRLSMILNQKKIQFKQIQKPKLSYLMIMN